MLSEVVSRTRAAGKEEEITVDPHRVECDDGHPGYCKVVNGAPFRGEIVGFQPLHEARANLEEALALFFETASSEEIERRLHSEVYVTHVEVAVG